MADTFLRGSVTAYGIQTPEVINDISAFLVTMFVPETPLMSMLERQPVDTVTFEWLNSQTRPRSNTVGSGGMADGSTTTLPVADPSMYLVGDILQIESEYLEITAVGSTSVTVIRGAAGSTAAAHTATTAITLIGNSRTGDEIDQDGARVKRTKSTQYCQTYQFPVQVSGSAQSTRAVLPAGIADLFTSFQVETLRNMKRDMEFTAYYGPGEAPSSGTSRPKQKGLKALITTNKTTSPTNAGAYTPDDFIRDGIQKCRDGGGHPNAALVSTGFLRGLAKWGMTPERTTVGETALGTPITALKVPFLGMDVRFIEAQQLGSPTNHTCVLFNLDELKYRAKRNEFWNPRGNRGDRIEGEYIGEGAIQLVNESHHAWIEGVTGFSA